MFLKLNFIIIGFENEKTARNNPPPSLPSLLISFLELSNKKKKSTSCT